MSFLRKYMIYLLLHRMVVTTIPATRLPSSRELASQLEISRNVVLEAYDLLLSEGYLEARQGAGTFVAEGAAYTRKVNVEPPEVEEVTMGYDTTGEVIDWIW